MVSAADSVQFLQIHPSFPLRLRSSVPHNFRTAVRNSSFTMDPNSLLKGVKSGVTGLKRAAERVSYEVMGSVGFSNTESDPHFDSIQTAYSAQTDTVRSLRSDAISAFDAIARAAATAFALAVRLEGALSGPDSDARLAVKALMSAQRFVSDEVLSKVERRVKKRIIAPADEELEKAKEIGARIQGRKRNLIDLQRYRQRDSEDDRRKAREKAIDIEVATTEIVAMMNAAMPRRAAFIERAVAETIEFQRKFYMDSSRRMERAVEAVGQEKLSAMRGTGEDPDVSKTNIMQGLEDEFVQQPRLQRRKSQSSPPPQPEELQPQMHHTFQSKTSNGASMWDEDDDDDDDTHLDHPSHPLHENPFDEPLASNPFEDSTFQSQEESSNMSASQTYSSVGAGKKDSQSSYPSSGVGTREKVGNYPTGGSRQTDGAYPTAGRGRPPSAVPASATAKPTATAARTSRRNRSDTETDLLNFESETVKPSSRPKKSTVPPAAAGTEDLLDLGKSNGSSRGPSTSAMEGDLLGDFGGVQPTPARSRSTNSTRSRGPSPSVSTSSSAPMMRAAPQSSSPIPAAAVSGGNLERERLRKMHEAEIKARADEKLAAVREREKAEEKERDEKDNSRGRAESKVNQWMGNGARRGNLRALLASLDTVLYPGATWQSVTMSTLKANSKVKVHYHKAILQVHPDKIGSKNLPPDQQVLAELIFDELKNAYEVWTAEQEGRPPPPGSVGPKGPPTTGVGATGGFTNMAGMARSGMYNMGGMGRAGMGMGGMGRGGMRGMGMGSMGRGMGMGGFGGRGMGGMSGMGGMGGMSGMGGMGAYAGTGRRGTGLGNMPQGFGNGRNTQRR